MMLLPIPRLIVHPAPEEAAVGMAGRVEAVEGSEEAEGVEEG
jgi:hypothetical protein